MASSLGPYWPLSYRGKCSVTLLNETDILSQYLEKEVSRVVGRGTVAQEAWEEGVARAPPGPCFLLPPVSRRTVFFTRWCLTLCRRHF